MSEPFTNFEIENYIVEDDGAPGRSSYGPSGMPWFWAFLIICALVGIATWQGNKTDQAESYEEAVRAKAFYKAKEAEAEAHSKAIQSLAR